MPRLDAVHSRVTNLLWERLGSLLYFSKVPKAILNCRSTNHDNGNHYIAYSILDGGKVDAILPVLHHFGVHPDGM